MGTITLLPHTFLLKTFLIPVSGTMRPVTQTLLVNMALMICGEIKQFHPNISLKKSDLREGKDKL